MAEVYAGVYLTALTADNFDAEVLSADAGLVFVFYWRPGCAVCQALRPEVEAFAEKNKDRVKCCTLDAAAFKQLSVSQKVLRIPSFFIYHNGAAARILARYEADTDAAQAVVDAV